MYVTITNGELAEWSNAAVLKTVVPQGTRGSNPLLSANYGFNKNHKNLNIFFLFYFDNSNHLYQVK